MLRRSHGALCYQLVAAASTRRRRRLVARTPVIAPGPPPASANAAGASEIANAHVANKAHPRASVLSIRHSLVPHIPVQAATPQRAGTADVRIVSPDGSSAQRVCNWHESRPRRLDGEDAVDPRTFRERRQDLDPVSVQGCVLLLSDGVRVALGGCGNPLMSAEPHGESVLWLDALAPSLHACKPAQPAVRRRAKSLRLNGEDRAHVLLNRTPRAGSHRSR